MSDFQWTEDHDYAFPNVKPWAEPTGQRLIVQVRCPKKKTKGGIILTDGTRESEKWNTAIARIVAAGPLAFKNRDSFEEWPEGAWAQVGDFVVIPKYGAHNWQQPVPGRAAGEEALFAIINDRDIQSLWVADPLAFQAWVIGDAA